MKIYLLIWYFCIVIMWLWEFYQELLLRHFYRVLSRASTKTLIIRFFWAGFLFFILSGKKSCLPSGKVSQNILASLQCFFVILLFVVQVDERLYCDSNCPSHVHTHVGKVRYYQVQILCLSERLYYATHQDSAKQH